ncbi:coproporphyrinogen III oxidase, anaerobic [Georgenia satyanarayanai]|uniref:Heme chaperone HemW n=1 Tax=Georgenia satyanarayanai TaxID=860221 RepID=A0A2Y8ZYQ2_9MICO|nr:radical SAM family heme chaperone HemW [Georgenia satyanarayanai]PYG01608.1 anaerobic coproporphyrinogen III oxidase [Georgenia satyanarayanai]SSA36408.1 coproporphyrinogen III oxidase, anaerobic [Georgenia satyanarayanai]
MSPALPAGEPVPADGALPASAAAGSDQRDFGVYLHVPFCRVRCGYCDFNTYTATELGGGASQAAYADTARREVDLAAGVLSRAGVAQREVSTVFVGGGTPTLLPAADLAAMLAHVRGTWGLADGAEVTTEANPDSVTPASLEQLADAGFTRVSFGMQSAVPHVLATLDRTHDPARLPDVVRWARDAGLDVSVDLIYGTPGESAADWRTSLETAVALEPDHVSAYALGIEPGTKMGAQVRRGELPMPDDDDAALKYEAADDVLTAAGLSWYEVSNFATTPEHACRHNLNYWRGADWWGIGPGAHSHVGGVRWWNVKHPRAYAHRLDQGLSPGAGHEVLDDGARELERVLLGVRLAEGLELAPGTGRVPEKHREAVAGLIAEGLVDMPAARAGRILLTRRGRLLADTVVRALTD